MKSYLVATKLNGRSFIMPDSATDDFEKAESLAKQYANSPLWQGAELVILWNNTEMERRSYEKRI